MYAHDPREISLRNNLPQVPGEGGPSGGGSNASKGHKRARQRQGDRLRPGLRGQREEQGGQRLEARRELAQQNISLKSVK